jgi:hypothetical protein
MDRFMDATRPALADCPAPALASLLVALSDQSVTPDADWVRALWVAVRPHAQDCGDASRFPFIVLASAAGWVGEVPPDDLTAQLLDLALSSYDDDPQPHHLASLVVLLGERLHYVPSPQWLVQARLALGPDLALLGPELQQRVVAVLSPQQ